MNKFNLKFYNEQLEARYQTYANNIQIDIIIEFLCCNQLSLMILCISFSFTDHYYGLAIVIICALANLTYLVMMKCVRSVKLILIYELVNFLAPETLLIMIYQSNATPQITNNLQIWLVLNQLSMIFSQKNILAYATICNNFLVLFAMSYINSGFAIFNFTWAPYIFVCCSAFYWQQYNRRLLFQESQVNESIYELLKTTSNEQFMIFRYDEEQLVFKLELTNIENFNLSLYLKSISVTPKLTLSQYIYQNHFIIQHDQSMYKNKIFGYEYSTETGRKNKIQMELYTQPYPKLKFYLRIMQVQQNPTNISLYDSRFKNIYKIVMKIASSQLSQEGFKYHLQHLNHKIFRMNLVNILQQPKRFVQTVENFNIKILLERITKSLKIQLAIKGDSECLNHKLIITALFTFILLMIKRQTQSVKVMIGGKFSVIRVTFQYDHKAIDINHLKQNDFINKLEYLNQFVSPAKLIFKPNNVTCFLSKECDIGFLQIDQYR